MKLIKDTVIKDVPENLISLYIVMGWREYKGKSKNKENYYTLNKDKENNE